MSGVRLSRTRSTLSLDRVGGKPWPGRLKRIGGALAFAGLLGGTFMAYLRPDVAFTLANQLWHCF